jgi:hypothetical protein
MKFPYYFKREELADYYRDWEIIESAEVENKFSNGGLGTVAFIIARKR